MFDQDEKQLKRLVGRARDGDHEAFQLLFDAFVDQIFNYALSRTRQRQIALEVTQDTFVALWDALPNLSYRGREPLVGFLFVVVKRKIFADRKENEKQEYLANTLSREDSFEEEHEDYRHLMHALEQMSPEYQEAIRLRYWGALSFAEIAHALGMNENAARVLHHRAVKKLQESASLL